MTTKFAGTVVGAVFALSGAAVAGSLTPDVIFGSGNSNRGFEVTQDAGTGLELGLRAKLRFGPSGPNDALGVGIIQDVNGAYLFDSGISTAAAGVAMWSFDWGINSNFNSAGGGLDSYSYTISVDTDATVNDNGAIVYDPLGLISTGAYLGTNATGNGGASFTSNLGLPVADLTNNNVAQNSVQPHWIGGPTGSGQFTITLAAFDQAGMVASQSIDVIVDGPAPIPVPASLPLLAGALGGLMWMRKRRKS